MSDTKRVQAVWNGTILADSDKTVRLEGNHYFPLASVRKDFMQPSEKHTRCPWKGRASYYDVVVDGEVNSDAAWYYPKPWPLARMIKDRVAFWQGVRIIEP